MLVVSETLTGSGLAFDRVARLVEADPLEGDRIVRVYGRQRITSSEGGSIRFCHRRSVRGHSGKVVILDGVDMDEDIAPSCNAAEIIC